MKVEIKRTSVLKLTAKIIMGIILAFVIITLVATNYSVAQNSFTDSVYRGMKMAEQAERIKIEKQRLEMQKKSHELELEKQRLELERQKLELESMRRKEVQNTIGQQDVSPCERNCGKMYLEGALKKGLNVNDCIQTLCK